MIHGFNISKVSSPSFPAGAGVILPLSLQGLVLVRVSRRRGGDPLTFPTKNEGGECFPQARG